MPIGYHGRAGTVVIGGTPVRRPSGQSRRTATRRVFGPSRAARHRARARARDRDAERVGEPVAVERALDHVFGVVLLNDWSARDLQAWEYQPLGPFLGKSFATSIGAVGDAAGGAPPSASPRPPQEPGAAAATCARSRGRSTSTSRSSSTASASTRTNARHLYWSARAADRAPDLQRRRAAHRRPARLRDDLGPRARERGSLLELTWNGAEPLALADGASARSSRTATRSSSAGSRARATRRWRSPRSAAGSWRRRRWRCRRRSAG